MKHIRSVKRHIWCHTFCLLDRFATSRGSIPQPHIMTVGFNFPWMLWDTQSSRVLLLCSDERWWHPIFLHPHVFDPFLPLDWYFFFILIVTLRHKVVVRYVYTGLKIASVNSKTNCLNYGNQQRSSMSCNMNNKHKLGTSPPSTVTNRRKNALDIFLYRVWLKNLVLTKNKNCLVNPSKKRNSQTILKG